MNQRTPILQSTVRSGWDLSRKSSVGYQRKIGRRSSYDAEKKKNKIINFMRIKCLIH